jgi:hypothetical protein
LLLIEEFDMKVSESSINPILKDVLGKESTYASKQNVSDSHFICG